MVRAELALSKGLVENRVGVFASCALGQHGRGSLGRVRPLGLGRLEIANQAPESFGRVDAVEAVQQLILYRSGRARIG
jgi:hypothetical protein